MKFTFGNRRYCGGSKTTVVNQPAQIAPPTKDQLRMEKISADYAEYIAPTAKMLANMGTWGFQNNQLNPNPNWSNLYDSGRSQINTANQSILDASNGFVNQNLMNNKMETINRGVKNSLGNAITGLAKRGIVNSGTANKAFDQIDKNTQQQMNDAYDSTLTQQSQLANQLMQSAYQPTSFASAAQNASIDIPAKYYALATGQTAPATDMWKAYLGQQTYLSSPAQSHIVQKQGSGFGSFIGGLAGGLF